MASRIFAIAFLTFAIIATSSSATPFPRCRGSAKYRVTFKNLLTRRNFGGLIPSSGLVYSPLSGFSHSNRFSFFTIRGFANRGVAQVAKTGSNRRIIRMAKRARSLGRGVKSIVNAGAPTMPGGTTSLILDVDCEHSFVTVIGMIAPSPDWIVQVNNRNLVDTRGRFVYSVSGDMIAYDAGVDSGREFTDPSDASLDIPTLPRDNIAPLVEDETDRFQGRVVGKFSIVRMKA